MTDNMDHNPDMDKDDDIIELTDIVDPSIDEIPDDDDAIELFDIEETDGDDEGLDFELDDEESSDDEFDFSDIEFDSEDDLDDLEFDEEGLSFGQGEDALAMEDPELNLDLEDDDLALEYEETDPDRLDHHQKPEGERESGKEAVLVEEVQAARRGSETDRKEETLFAPTEGQIQAALEKVIKEQFTEKIETMLYQAVEDVVKKEIADIKNNLLHRLNQEEGS
ncbi:MAG: hypothetical protein R6V54_07725 [Desulfobacteraceae bacterium]